MYNVDCLSFAEFCNTWNKKSASMPARPCSCSDKHSSFTEVVWTGESREREVLEVVNSPLIREIFAM